jgi:hypothetical protein
MSRTSSSGAVLDNGTNIGSAAGRKASIGQTFTLERRTSQSGSGRVSRRGSGAIMTPSGAHVVYHTRTDVSDGDAWPGTGSDDPLRRTASSPTPRRASRSLLSFGHC